MRLLLVELRRLFARRFFWVGGMVLLLGLGAVLAVTAVESRLPTANELATARQLAADDRPRIEAERRQCEEAERLRDAGETLPPELEGRFPASTTCAELLAPRAEDYLVVDVFRFAGEMANRTHALTAVLALFAFLVGATAIGAEWNHGTLGALLLWEPRRLRVFVAKLVALLGGVTVLAVVAYAANVAGHWGVAELRGVVGDLTPAFQRDLGLVAARGLAFTLVAGATGFALAFLVRRTAAALGVLIAYFGVAEIGGRDFFGERAQPYLLSSYVAAWLEDGVRLTIRDCSPLGACTTDTLDLTLRHGALYVGGVALAAVLVSALAFRRREVS
jgi:hypothetical protein